MGRKEKRRLKLTTVIMVVISFVVSLTYSPYDVKAATVINERDWTKYKSTYYYDHLDEYGKKFYDGMEAACIEFISTTADAKRLTQGTGENMVEYYNLPDVPAEGLDKKKASEIMEQFVYDNPQYYFLAGDGRDIPHTVGGVLNYRRSVAKPFADGETRAAITEQFFNKLETWEEEVKAAGTSRYAMEKAVTDIICKNVTYNYHDFDHNAYGAVITGEAVCSGYAMTTAMLLNAVGVPATYVYSNRHAWNKVCLDDGNWYVIDTTWMDGETPDCRNDSINYKYFNISDEKICEIDSKNFHVITGPEFQPECKNIFDSSTVSDGGSSNNGNTNDAGNSGDNGSSGGTDNSGSTNNSGNSNSSGGSNSNNNSGNNSANTGYSNEWRNGKWYDGNGNQSYEGTLSWKCNSSGWWVEDTAGWYPANQWQKIDGIWYFFKPDGYMAMGEYYSGYWFNSDGSWDEKYFLSWKCNSSGWWVEDISGWWPASSWLKIDGSWYYFDSTGYMATNQYVDGYWIGADGVCQ